jgi:hypothetical protein
MEMVTKIECLYQRFEHEPLFPLTIVLVWLWSPICYTLNWQCYSHLLSLHLHDYKCCHGEWGVMV